MERERLGKYVLLRLLATGGMGEVFLAEQAGPQDFKRRVVVKRLLRHLASDPTFVDMFLDEARIAALIRHPNVAQIIELGEEASTYFIAMEYVRGKSLRQLLRSVRAAGERIPPRVAVEIVVGVLRGLHAAHTLVDDDGHPRGCVHRDVSAENVLLSVDGAVKLVDFGIAKALSASTARGTMLRGKYGYMAPEQYLRERVDARTDVFAAGVLLFELAAGERPFVADNEAGIMHAIILEAPPALAERLGTPAALDGIVATALAKEPSARFASAAAMADALEALLASGALGTGEPTGALRTFAAHWLEDAIPSSEALGVPPPARTADLAAPPTADLPAPGTEPLSSHTLTAETVAAPTSAPPRRRAMIAFLALGAGGIAAIAAAMRFSHDPPSAPLTATATAIATAPAPTEAAPSASAVPATAPAPTADVTASAAPPVPSLTAETPVAKARRAPARDARRATATTVAGAAGTTASTGTGSLAFRVRPWAEIYVDGTRIGISPIGPVELPSGRHQVLFRNRDLGKERILPAQIAKGETTTLRVDLLE